MARNLRYSQYSFTFDIISPTANVGVLFTPLTVTIEDDDCKHNPLNMDALISDILYSQGTSFRPNAFFRPKSNKEHLSNLNPLYQCLHLGDIMQLVTLLVFETGARVYMGQNCCPL